MEPTTKKWKKVKTDMLRRIDKQSGVISEVSLSPEEEKESYVMKDSQKGSF